LYGTGRR